MAKENRTIIGIAQEFKAKKTVEKLSLLSAPSVTVLRDGEEKTIIDQQRGAGDRPAVHAASGLLASADVLQQQGRPKGREPGGSDKSIQTGSARHAEESGLIRRFNSGV